MNLIILVTFIQVQLMIVQSQIMNPMKYALLPCTVNSSIDLPTKTCKNDCKKKNENLSTVYIALVFERRDTNTKLMGRPCYYDSNEQWSTSQYLLNRLLVELGVVENRVWCVDFVFFMYVHLCDCLRKNSISIFWTVPSSTLSGAVKITFSIIVP